MVDTLKWWTHQLLILLENTSMKLLQNFTIQNDTRIHPTAHACRYCVWTIIVHSDYLIDVVIATW